jgi:hypothetical protein
MMRKKTNDHALQSAVTMTRKKRMTARGDLAQGVMMTKTIGAGPPFVAEAMMKTRTSVHEHAPQRDRGMKTKRMRKTRSRFARPLKGVTMMKTRSQCDQQRESVTKKTRRKTFAPPRENEIKTTMTRKTKFLRPLLDVTRMKKRRKRMMKSEEPFRETRRTNPYPDEAAPRMMMTTSQRNRLAGRERGF